MTAAQLVDKLLASEHAGVLRESIAWLVAELMDAEVARGVPKAGRGRDQRVPLDEELLCVLACSPS
jgi:hypothetical protein